MFQARRGLARNLGALVPPAQPHRCGSMRQAGEAGRKLGRKRAPCNARLRTELGDKVEK
jgi:hypothetical protein